jgi:hypothetical protein
MDSRYRMISLLGEGTFSQLLRCEDTFASGRPHVAIKVNDIPTSATTLSN